MRFWDRLNYKFLNFPFPFIYTFYFNTFKHYKSFDSKLLQIEKIPKFGKINCKFYRRTWQFNIPFFWPKKLGCALKRHLIANFLKHSEAVAQRCSVKKTFLEISQNSQENACARVSFLIKLQAWGLQFY